MARARYTGSPGYSNALLKDGVPIQIMGPRPPLAVGASRTQNAERVSDENLVVQVWLGPGCVGAVAAGVRCWYRKGGSCPPGKKSVSMLTQTPKRP